jgi:hypothetical protein
MPTPWQKETSTKPLGGKTGGEKCKDCEVQIHMDQLLLCTLGNSIKHLNRPWPVRHMRLNQSQHQNQLHETCSLPPLKGYYTGWMKMRTMYPVTRISAKRPSRDLESSGRLPPHRQVQLGRPSARCCVLGCCQAGLVVAGAH